LSAFVLDASALLAYLHDEAGAAEVTDVLASGATISAANLAEALSKLAERGADAGEVAAKLEYEGLLHGLLDVEPLTIEDAIAIADLRPQTRDRGLSLGDRACLALGIRLGIPVVTADRAWAELGAVLEVVEVRPVR
jgi:PIN domain nuclease of toxin-antitoxin system